MNMHIYKNKHHTQITMEVNQLAMKLCNGMFYLLFYRVGVLGELHIYKANAQ